MSGSEENLHEKSPNSSPMTERAEIGKSGGSSPIQDGVKIEKPHIKKVLVSEVDDEKLTPSLDHFITSLTESKKKIFKEGMDVKARKATHFVARPPCIIE